MYLSLAWPSLVFLICTKYSLCISHAYFVGQLLWHDISVDCLLAFVHSVFHTFKLFVYCYFNLLLSYELWMFMTYLAPLSRYMRKPVTTLKWLTTRHSACPSSPHLMDQCSQTTGLEPTTWMSTLKHYYSFCPGKAGYPFKYWLCFSFTNLSASFSGKKSLVVRLIQRLEIPSLRLSCFQ